MMKAIERNCREFDIRFFNGGNGHQGIVHVLGPELGLTQPGMTVACGDSHTSTHGAFGAVAFGIGTSQVRDVLASQCLAMQRPKVRRIDVTGALGGGVYAKDVILHVIRRLGVKGGVGYAYEFAGSVFERMTMEERMTVCNMSIEGGARLGYVNPDRTTFEYVRGREFAPQGDAFDRAMQWWTSIASDRDASYDDTVRLDGAAIAPTVTWGINPGQAIGVDETIPPPESFPADERGGGGRRLRVHGLEARRADPRDEASTWRSSARAPTAACPICAKRRGWRSLGHVAAHVKALVVPGSDAVARAAEAEGLHEVFRQAGFEWRLPGCSMCLAMNPDKLVGRQMCASSSNRNFKGRQGSPSGRTLLMSPAMVAAAALEGAVVDVRDMLPRA